MPGESLHDILLKKNIYWKLMITDSLTEVIHQLSDDLCKEKEFLLPKYGYCKSSDIINQLILTKDCSIRFYDPECSEHKVL